MKSDDTRTEVNTGRILPTNTLVSGRYRILRLLGVGAMGMVYLVRDTQLEIDVALKVLRQEGAGELRLERFRSELILARQISHRNVVRIHDIGQADDLHYLTMDYVDGRSLKQLLQSEGALDTARAVAVAADLAAALAAAHREGIVHRDVKPANVLLGEDRACLTDFGIARSLQSGGLTRTGEIVGTLDYLSPEQARGEPVDGRSDIYAVGLLLYEMLVGHRPFAGETAEEVLAQRSLARPLDFSGGGPAVTPALRRIVERCLRPDPADRYQSAAELLEDLRAGRSRRRGVLAGVWPAASAALVLVAAVWLWLASTDTDPRAPAPPAPAAEMRTVAVLPFEVAAQAGDIGSISHAVAELLAERLAMNAGLGVVDSRRVNAAMDGLKLDAGQLTAADHALLGDLLDAQYLVMGRLHRIDASYRLDAALLRPDSGETLYRTDFELEQAALVFEVLGELAARLLDSFDLSPVLDQAESPSLAAATLSAYTRGVEELSRGNAADAIELLQAVVKDSPRFAPAWDRLAQALASQGRDQDAIRAADAAVAALDGSYGRTGSLIRSRRWALTGRPADAARELEALLERFPTDVEARVMLAETYGDSGRLQDATAALQEVVAVSPDHPSAWYLLGKFSILQGDARRAADDYLVKALVIQNRLGNPQGRADALNALGIAQSQLGNPDEAATYYRQSLELRRQIGDDRGEAAVMANLARIDLEAGRYDDARSGLMGARDRLEGIGDRWTVANLENELGFLEERRGRFEAALAHYRESLRIREDLGDRRALAESYNNIGYAYFLLGQYDNSAVFNRQSLDTYRETDNLEGIMLASETKGILDMARGRYDDALAALLEALRLSREIGDPQTEAIAQGYIGRVHHLRGRYAAAAESFDEALAGLDELGDWRGLAEFVLLDAELSLDLGLWDRAAAAIERAGALLEDDDNQARRALYLVIEGTYDDAMGNAETAAERFATAVRAAEASGDRVRVLQARLALAAAAAGGGPGGRTGDLDELRAVHEAAIRIGHGQLTIESGLTLAQALSARERFDDAAAVLRDALQRLPAESGFRVDYRLHALLAQVLETRGDAQGAASEWLLADAAVERAIESQNEAQRRAFQELPTVRLAREQQVARHED